MGNNSTFIIILILLVGTVFYFYFQSPKNVNSEIQTTSGELMRTIPMSVNPGQTFQITYSSDKQGKWGAIIVDSVSGGCLFSNGKTGYKSVMLSENGPQSEIVEVTAPSSGSCTFTGDYNFEVPIIKFPDQTIQVK